MGSTMWKTAFVVLVCAGASAVGGCSAATDPEEKLQETNEDALTCGRTPCAKPAPVCYAPRVWSYPFKPVSWPSCIMENELLTEFRAFNGTAYEEQLSALGCSYGLADGSKNQVRSLMTENGNAYSISACPAGCAIDNLTNTFGTAITTDGTRLDPTLSTSGPTSCQPTLPANVVWVEWDPHCPGGCPLKPDPT